MNMNSLNRWLALLANVAVFASIMFLAIEIRQNQTAIEESNRLSVLGARQVAIEQFNDFRSTIAEDPELARIWFDGLADRELDPLDKERFMLLCNNVIWMSAGSYESSIVLNRTDVAEGTAATRASMIDASQAFKECWLRLRGVFNTYGLSDYVDSVESKVETELLTRE